MLLQSRACSDVLDTAKSTAALVRLVSPLGKSLELVFHQGTWSCVLAGGFLTVVLWTAHRLRLRVLTDRVRNLLAERLSERERAARELNDTLLQGMQGRHCTSPIPGLCLDKMISSG
jgi:signal transduction histidine kinase